MTADEIQERMDATQLYIDLLQDPLVSPSEIPTIARLRGVFNDEPDKTPPRDKQPPKKDTY